LTGTTLATTPAEPSEIKRRSTIPKELIAPAADSLLPTAELQLDRTNTCSGVSSSQPLQVVDRAVAPRRARNRRETSGLSARNVRRRHVCTSQSPSMAAITRSTTGFGPRRGQPPPYTTAARPESAAPRPRPPVTALGRSPRPGTTLIFRQSPDCAGAPTAPRGTLLGCQPAVARSPHGGHQAPRARVQSFRSCNHTLRADARQPQTEYTDRLTLESPADFGQASRVESHLRVSLPP